MSNSSRPQIFGSLVELARLGLVFLPLVWPALSACATVVAQREELLPVDEAVTVPGLYASRAAIVKATLNHDVATLERWLSDDLGRSPIERESLMEGFRKNPRTLRALGETLLLGGQFVSWERDREFCAPYVNTAYPEIVPDHLTYEGHPWVVTVPRAEVRQQPSESSPVVGVLSFELVRVDEGLPDPESEWRRVILPNGPGYVRASTLRSRDDYVACLKPDESGTWKLWRFHRF